MERGILVRLGVVALSVVVSVWLLLPTFLGKEVQANLELAAERAKMDDPPPLDAPLPDYVKWLPNTKVNLGLDLQGGIDLTLEVGVEEGLLSSVQRDIPGLKSAADKQDIKLADVRRDPKAPVLLITPADGTTLDQVQTLVRSSLRRYAYKNTLTDNGKTVHAFEMDPASQDEIRKRSVEQALETIRNRIDETGVKEPSITIKGSDGIDVQLPGETDVEDALATVGTTARLVFMLVDEESPLKDAEGSFRPLMAAVSEAQAAMSPEAFANDRALSQWLVDQGKVAPGRIVLWHYEKQDGKDVRTFPYVLRDEELITGDDINSASTGTDPTTGQYEVHLDFKPRGSQIFGQVTGANLQKRFAIVLDDKVRSAPTIQAQIFDNCRITVGGDGVDGGKKEAGTLALVLRSGALPAPVTPGDVRLVSASLGEQAIHEGLLAAVGGSLLVLLFAAVYYRLSGVVACVSLVINVLLVLALLAVVGATLTLPGICGIALTVGMAVDCNIIIYERIREELRAGRSPRLALEAGFEHAVVAVVDANVTTLLAGVVLYSYGTGPLKGFAVTLMIGIFTTLFTGVFVSRSMLSFLVGLRRSSNSLSI